MKTKPSHPRLSCRKQTARNEVPCSVTMPAEMQEAVIKHSKRNDRSFSATVRVAVKRYLENSAA